MSAAERMEIMERGFNYVYKNTEKEGSSPTAESSSAADSQHSSNTTTAAATGEAAAATAAATDDRNSTELTTEGECSVTQLHQSTATDGNSEEKVEDEVTAAVPAAAVPVPAVPAVAVAAAAAANANKGGFYIGRPHKGLTEMKVVRSVNPEDKEYMVECTDGEWNSEHDDANCITIELRDNNQDCSQQQQQQQQQGAAAAAAAAAGAAAAGAAAGGGEAVAAAEDRAAVCL
ncbi:hypothetical protein, conserved [Eimeria praecox]|uniref:Uncharacterized protein n=1 Tax=Eimeria praecox TaxID=51316 RepID=U6H7H4_9EIME|nr:hypothetical protein, conserved [Eimeria praecox]